jgi:hypothetical protein
VIDLNARADATRRTAAKYRAKPFSWANRATCIHLARTQLRNLGHMPPPIPDFRSALGARRALLRAGFSSVSDLLDSLLPRISPARMLVGDLAVIEGDEGFDGIVVSAGGKMLGWNEADASGLRILVVREYLGAWRS